MLTDPQPITLAMLTAGLRVFASIDIRDLPPVPLPEPFRCPLCLDLGQVTGWAGHRTTWLWQRFEPYRRIPCPGCTQRISDD